MIYAKCTNEKVYIENEYQCLARMCKTSSETFDIYGFSEPFEHASFDLIKNGKPTLKDWNIFKKKVKDKFDFCLEDDFIPKSFGLKS